MGHPDNQAFMNWSGGKDAAFSLFKLQADKKFDVRYLFTTLNEVNRRISMHGVREELLKQQSQQIGIPLKVLCLPEQTDLPTYNHLMQHQLQAFSDEGVRYALFGDIFLEDLKKYREKQLAQRQMKAVFPLWKKDTRQLIHAFLEAGFKAVITCVNAELLDKSFAGRLIDHDFIRDLPPGVDPCGENGEFHSFVFDGPLFSDPIKFQLGEVIEKTYAASSADKSKWDTRFYFRDLLAV